MNTSITTRAKTGCGNLYVTIIFTNKGVVDNIFANLGKSGTCAFTFMSSYCAILSKICKDINKKTFIGILKETKGNMCQFGADSCIEKLNLMIIDVLGTDFPEQKGEK